MSVLSRLFRQPLQQFLGRAGDGMRSNPCISKILSSPLAVDKNQNPAKSGPLITSVI